MAPRSLPVTLFHLLFVPIVWAAVLYMAVRTEYKFSPIQSVWMGIDLLAAILFRIVVTMELIWGLEIALLRLPSYNMIKLAFSAISGVVKFYNEWTFIGAMLLVVEKILVEKILPPVLLYFGIGNVEILAEGGQYWCFLAFVLIGYYELVAFCVLVFLRLRAELQAGGPESTKLQAGPEGGGVQAGGPECTELQAGPERASVSVAIV